MSPMSMKKRAEGRFFSCADKGSDGGASCYYLIVLLQDMVGKLMLRFIFLYAEVGRRGYGCHCS